jgi:hypothetical protein
MSLSGVGLGLALGHGLAAIGGWLIQAETGLRFSALHLGAADAWALPLALALGCLAGLPAASQAYRLGVLENLTPIS